MPRARHLLALAAAQHVGDVRGAEPLPDRAHARQDLARQHDRLGDRLELAEAVVAGAAVVACVALAEVADQMRCGGSRRSRRSAPCRAAAAARVGQLAVRSSITRHFRKSAAE